MTAIKHTSTAEPLASFCLILRALLFFLAKSLSETVEPSEKFQPVTLVREPINEGIRPTW